MKLIKLLLLILALFVPMMVNADPVEINGICYNLVLKAQMAEVTSNPNKYSGNVVIPQTVTYGGVGYSVTSIGSGAFSGCGDLTSVTIPNSVTSIGGYAFSGCSGQTSVTIPNSVTSIGNGAFYGCSGLTSVTIPNSVTSIGENTFYKCSSLTSVVIPNSVTSIGMCAFQFCSGLTSLIIPNSVTSIGHSAFADCSGLTSVTIPNSVTSIGSGAFSGCGDLTSVTIPNSVTSIGGYAFSGCSGLTSVTIPNSVTSIGEDTFKGCCSLTSITIPNSVTSINRSAFWECSGLTSVTIPNSVTSIGNGAFYGCSGLTSITIGSGVTSIGSISFSQCPDLTDVYCYAENVPFSFSEAFEGSYIEYATLHVPKGSLDAYKKSVPWMNFKSIVEMVDAKVKLSMTKATIEKGKSSTLKATVTPEDLADKSVTWESSNTKVATVSSAGKVKAVKTGTTTITCTSVATGAKATCKVTVGQVVLSKSEAIVAVGKTGTLKATVYPETLADKSVTWTTSDKKVATVSTAGKVKAVGVGTAIITCTSNATGLKATCTLTVGQVVLSKTEAIVAVGKTGTLKATVYPETLADKSVTWKSSDTEVATVTSAGKVKAVGVGTAIITCTSKATGLKATCTLTVGKVVLSKTKATVAVGKSGTLKATVYPETLEDKSVTWKTSDKKVATVSSAGKVRGVGVGTAIITCTSVATGLSATCTVTVAASAGTRSLDGDDDGFTDIEDMEMGPAVTEPFDVYDLSGRKVRHQVTSLDGLPNGIYIVNGKKMLKK